MTEGKEVKGVQFGMREIKPSLFAEDIPVLVGNLKSTLQCKAILIQKLVWCSKVIQRYFVPTPDRFLNLRTMTIP